MSKISGMLKEIIEKEKITIRGLARAINVDHASLIRSLRDAGNPESRTVEKILDFFGYEIRLIKSKKKEVKPDKSKQSKKRR